MKIFIVSAHPEPKSFTNAMRDQSIGWLKDAGHDVIVSDLYEMGYNPVSGSEDFTQRAQPEYLTYALEQRKGWQNGTLKEDVRIELEKLEWCDLLILNFPIYWFSVPAILKGWIDKTFISGRTYGGKRFYENGGLKGKKALVAFTLGGRDHMFGPDAIHGEIEDMLRPLLRGTLRYVGMDVLPPFIAYHVPYITNEDRQTYLNQYKDYLLNLENLTPLDFPRMSDFNEQLYPKQAP